MEKPSTPAFHRPLVVRIAAMGDAVLLVPMLKALHHRFGQSCDLVSAGPWIRPVLGHCPAVAEIMLLESRRTPYLLEPSQRALVRWLRQRPPGPVYVCESDDKTLWLLRRGGVAEGWICSLRDIPPLQAHEHQIEHQQRLVARTPRALGGEPVPVDASADHAMAPPPGAVEECRGWLESRNMRAGRLILVQPGNKRTMRRGSRKRRSNVKHWPEERWGALLRGLRQEAPDAAVLLCGSPQEFEFLEAIRRASPANQVFNLARDLPIPRLMALQTLAHSMISVDTGPAHLATAVGCPLLVLYPRPGDRRYYPRPTTAPVEILAPPDSAEARAAPHPLLFVAADTVLERWRALARSLEAPR